MPPEKGKRFLRKCGWCQKINLFGRWIDPHEAKDLETRPIFDGITHGLCSDCAEKLRQSH